VSFHGANSVIAGGMGEKLLNRCGGHNASIGTGRRKEFQVLDSEDARVLRPGRNLLFSMIAAVAEGGFH